MDDQRLEKIERELERLRREEQSREQRERAAGWSKFVRVIERLHGDDGEGPQQRKK